MEHLLSVLSRVGSLISGKEKMFLDTDTWNPASGLLFKFVAMKLKGS